MSDRRCCAALLICAACVGEPDVRVAATSAASKPHQLAFAIDSNGELSTLTLRGGTAASYVRIGEGPSQIEEPPGDLSVFLVAFDDDDLASRAPHYDPQRVDELAIAGPVSDECSRQGQLMGDRVDVLLPEAAELFELDKGSFRFQPANPEQALAVSIRVPVNPEHCGTQYEGPLELIAESGTVVPTDRRISAVARLSEDRFLIGYEDGLRLVARDTTAEFSAFDLPALGTTVIPNQLLVSRNTPDRFDWIMAVRIVPDDIEGERKLAILRGNVQNDVITLTDTTTTSLVVDIEVVGAEYLPDGQVVFALSNGQIVVQRDAGHEPEVRVSQPIEFLSFAPAQGLAQFDYLIGASSGIFGWSSETGVFDRVGDTGSLEGNNVHAFVQDPESDELWLAAAKGSLFRSSDHLSHVEQVRATLPDSFSVCSSPIGDKCGAKTSAQPIAALALMSEYAAGDRRIVVVLRECWALLVVHRDLECGSIVRFPTREVFASPEERVSAVELADGMLLFADRSGALHQIDLSVL